VVLTKTSRVLPALATALALSSCFRPGASVSSSSAPKVNLPCSAQSGWGDPTPPRHIYGNTWYVGTCGLSAILITSPQGHVLIDGAIEEAAPQILANIRALDFKPSDIRALLNSHEHYDHAGGLAALQRESGAKLYARAPSSKVLLTGTAQPNDPQFGSLKAFPPVGQTELIGDRQVVRVGALEVTAVATPGHSPGSTSWFWTSCERGRCLQLVYADSLSAISNDTFLFSDTQQNPNGLVDFFHTLEKVAALPCDILMTPHPGASTFWERLDTENGVHLVNPNACRAYAETAKQNLERRIAEEKTRAR
jgi:metallo-beta-lactamase class B